MRLAQGASQRDFNSRLRFRDSRLALDLTCLRNNQLLLPEQFWRTKRNLGLPGKQCGQVVVLFLWPRLALKSRLRPIPLDGSFSDGLPAGFAQQGRFICPASGSINAMDDSRIGSFKRLFYREKPLSGRCLLRFLIYGSFYYGASLRKGYARFWKLSLWKQWCSGASLVGAFWLMYSYPPVGILDPNAARNQTLVNRGMLEDLSASSPCREFSMRFTQGNPVVPEFLQMELLAKGIAMKKISSGMEKNLAGAIKKLDQV